MMNTDSKTFVFGDIEGFEPLFTSTMNTIEANKHDPNVKFIFLGDVYDYNKSTVCIEQIGQILNALDIPIKHIFTRQSKEIEVIRLFRKLWKVKQMKCYSKFHIQYVHSKLKPEIVDSNEKVIFILGNKETIFVREIITSEKIMKSNDGFIVPTDYHRKHKRPDQPDIKHIEYLFTINQLNVMYTYLMLAHNYAIIDDKMFIHCYINYKTFDESVKNSVKHVVAGHSKGYGHFIDSEFEDVDIFIVDLTGTEGIANNFMTIEDETFTHNFNDNFKPYLEKLQFVPTEGINIIDNPKFGKE